MEALKDLAKQLYIRDPRKLFVAAKSRGLEVTTKSATEALKTNIAKQVLSMKPRALGKTAATGPEKTFQADLIDFALNTDAKKASGHKFVLVVEDVFTREVSATPLKSKDAAAVKRAFKADLDLLEAKPNPIVSTDAGKEFSSLDTITGLYHIVKNPADRNSLGVVDRAIQTIKRNLADASTRAKDFDWSKEIGKVVSAYNSTYHSTTYAAPEDVKKQPAT